MNSYVDILKERIIAEAKFLGVKEGAPTIAEIISDVNKALEEDINRQSEQMLTMGMTFDFRNIAEMTTKKMSEKKDLSRPDSFLNNPKWAEIAETFVAVEEAATARDIVLSIDKLNHLQHNSFHVLIDLQSGRMLDHAGTSHEDASSVLERVLNLKAEAGSVFELTDDMSEMLQELMEKYRESAMLKV